MATTKTAPLAAATDAVRKELEAGPRTFEDTAELAEYVADCDRLIEVARQVKKQYAKQVAVMASQKSRAAKKERVARALALLEAQEAEASVS